jgi:thiosulfate reductase cytochrome b subunit
LEIVILRKNKAVIFDSTGVSIYVPFMAIWITGWAYLFYASWSAWGLGSICLTWVALLHTAGAFAMLAFIAAHLYFTLTTSEKPFAFVKTMITGYEEGQHKE